MRKLHKPEKLLRNSSSKRKSVKIFYLYVERLFSKLNVKDLTYNKKFWKTIKPFLALKVKTRIT